jgi:phosphohistidine phosphatase
MKILTLIRHAKSSRDYPGLDDIDRPLNARGRSDAPLMARVLAGRNFAPDRLYSSPALRALRTAQAVAAAIDYAEGHIVLDSRWYQLEADGLLSVLQALEPPLEWVACVGHNPALTDLVNLLSPRRLENIPTCGIVELRFDTDSWHQLGRIHADRMLLDLPKTHRPPSSQGFSP